MQPVSPDGLGPSEQRGSPPSPTTRWAATHDLQDAEVDDGSMHDPRTSTALRTLAQLTGGPPPRRWSWSIGRLDRAGRLCLGQTTADALGPGPLVLRWHHLALLVEPDWRPGGRRASLDERGRLLAPAWLRERGRDVLVGLDRRGDVLVGGVR